MPNSDAGNVPAEDRKSRKQPCSFFLKTGNCAFGDQCKFEHPADQPPTKYNSLGLPLREGEPDCVYYVKNLHCGYGASCKFHHAEPVVGWMAMPSMPGQGRYPFQQMPSQSLPSAAHAAPGYGMNQAMQPHSEPSRLSAMNHAMSIQNYQYSMAMMQQQALMGNQLGMGLSGSPAMVPMGYSQTPAVMQPNYPIVTAQQPPQPGAPTWGSSHQPVQGNIPNSRMSTIGSVGPFSRIPPHLPPEGVEQVSQRLRRGRTPLGERVHGREQGQSKPGDEFRSR